MLKADKISFHYRKNAPIFEDLSFDIKNGGMVSIIGPNGAGKSTLLKCINRINRVTAGKIFIDGIDANSFSNRELSRRIGYVPQDTGSGFAISVADAVMLGRTPYIRFRATKEDKDKVFEMIEKLGLEQHAFSNLNELSGGERQRVFIARALVQEPQIMLLDEPISNLDIRYQLETLELIKDIVETKNIVSVMVIHDLSFAYRYSDFIIMMKKNKEVLEGSRDIITTSTIRDFYHVNVEILSDNEFPYINPQNVPSQ